jgi:hypothetical protein
MISALSAGSFRGFFGFVGILCSSFVSSPEVSDSGLYLVSEVTWSNRNTPPCRLLVFWTSPLSCRGREGVQPERLW